MDGDFSSGTNRAARLNIWGKYEGPVIDALNNNKLSRLLFLQRKQGGAGSAAFTDGLDRVSFYRLPHARASRSKWKIMHDRKTWT